jgi:hypothetical protein
MVDGISDHVHERLANDVENAAVEKRVCSCDFEVDFLTQLLGCGSNDATQGVEHGSDA